MDQVESKSLIRAIALQQQELCVPLELERLTSEDLEFVSSVEVITQTKWSVDVSAIPLPLEMEQEHDPVLQQVEQKVDEWIENHILLPQSCMDAYYHYLLQRIVAILVALELAAPENPAEWIVLHLKQQSGNNASTTSSRPSTGIRPKSPQSRPGTPYSSSPSLNLCFKTNYELMRRIDGLKEEQDYMHARRQRLEAIHTQFKHELALRAQFIMKLSIAHITTRTQAIMEGTPVFINGQKHWIIPDYYLVPSKLSSEELLALERAERFVMEADETRWRRLLRAQLEYDSSIKIQTAWRCFHAYKKYQQLLEKRLQSIIIIQRAYFKYLYHRAVTLPPWCVLGHEVVVSHTIALQCALTFQFYPFKDFPSGNYKSFPPTTSVQELMTYCRHHEECAGFTTDGVLKRFVPRKLSQLKPMTVTTSTTEKPGLYIKILPKKNEAVVNSGIIVDLPADRFGHVRIALDGLGIVESVPLHKVRDRWRLVHIRRHFPKMLHRGDKKRMTVVFGAKLKIDDVKKRTSNAHSGSSNQSTISTQSGTSWSSSVEVEVDTTPLARDFDILSEEEVLAIRRRRRQRQQSDLEESLLDVVYEDQVTMELREREPKHTFSEEQEREYEIAKRIEQYREKQEIAMEAKYIASVIRLQCAWRSKRARDAFRQALLLRAKEKERELLVTQVRRTHPKSKPHGFFTKWFKV